MLPQGTRPLDRNRGLSIHGFEKLFFFDSLYNPGRRKRFMSSICIPFGFLALVLGRLDDLPNIRECPKVDEAQAGCFSVLTERWNQTAFGMPITKTVLAPTAGLWVLLSLMRVGFLLREWAGCGNLPRGLNPLYRSISFHRILA